MENSKFFQPIHLIWLYLFCLPIGVVLVKKALRIPCLTIAKNAGVDGHAVVEKVLNSTGDMGYDALKNEYVNLIERGIIDPTKVCFELNKKMYVAVCLFAT